MTVTSYHAEHSTIRYVRFGYPYLWLHHYPQRIRDTRDLHGESNEIKCNVNLLRYSYYDFRGDNNHRCLD